MHQQVVVISPLVLEDNVTSSQSVLPRSISTMWNRVRAIRSKKPAAQKSSNEWITHLITATNLVRGVGKMTPFSIIEGAAETILVLLKPIQQMEQNQEDFKALASSIVSLVVSLRDEALSIPEAAKISPSFNLTCIEFNNMLTELLAEINTALNPKDKSWQVKYLKSSDHHDLIARYEKRVKSLIENCTLVTTTGIRFRIDGMSKDVVDMKTQIQSVTPPVESSLLAQYDKIPLGKIELLDDETTEEVPGLTEEATGFSDRAANINSMASTVRWYTGATAAKLWLADLELYTRIRHPRILQLFGVSHSDCHHALIFRGQLSSMKDYVTLLTPTERVVFIHGLSVDNRSAWNFLKQYLTPLSDVDLNVYHYGHAHNYSFRTLVNPAGKICISIEQRRIRKPSSWRAAQPIARVTGPLSAKVKKSVQLNSWEELPDRKELLLAFHDMALCTVSQKRDLRAVSIPGPLLLCGIYVGWEKYAVGRVYFPTQLRCRQVSTAWTIEKGGENVIVTATNEWTRFTVTRSSDQPSVVMAQTAVLDSDSEELLRAWVAQVIYLLPMIQRVVPFDLNRDDERILLATDVCGVVQFDATFRPEFPEFQRGLREAYLFVQNIRVLNDGTVPFPDVFWSMDPAGGSRLPKQAAEMLGLRVHGLWLRASMQRWLPYHYKALRSVHRACGLDSDTMEVRKFLNLPAVCFEAVKPASLTRPASAMSERESEMQQAKRPRPLRQRSQSWVKAYSDEKDNMEANLITSY